MNQNLNATAVAYGEFYTILSEERSSSWLKAWKNAALIILASVILLLLVRKIVSTDAWQKFKAQLSAF